MKSIKMKKQQFIKRAISTFVVLLVVLILGAAKSSIAGKPQGEDNSGSVWEVLQAEGLSGEHHTLNIHGKKSDFNKQDCTAEPDPITGEYGNNIFMPSNSVGTLNQILIVSGKGKGSKKDLISAYGVRDTCTNEFDGDAAEVILPPNDKGYFVVARVLGKPTDDPSLTIENGELMFVEDESGNDLLVLGLVTNDGWQTPSVKLTRTKGKVTAVDITGLFLWSGDVCYFDTTNYCTEEDPCENKDFCCTYNESTGNYDKCYEASEDEIMYSNCDGLNDGLIYELMTLGCQNYLNTWVFNIGDLVGAMWEMYADGNFKLVNIRFYPVK
jgi:hypothetical protein